jgi:hypothetical protein
VQRVASGGADVSEEFGVFTDEGAVANDFYVREHAEAWMEANCDPGEAHVGEVCPDHRGHERAFCEPCDIGDEP